jgi:hypothetical protein
MNYLTLMLHVSRESFPQSEDDGEKEERQHTLILASTLCVSKIKVYRSYGSNLYFYDDEKWFFLKENVHPSALYIIFSLLHGIFYINGHLKIESATCDN